MQQKEHIRVPQKAEEAAEKVDDGLGAYQEKLNNTVKEYDKDWMQVLQNAKIFLIQ